MIAGSIGSSHYVSSSVYFWSWRLIDFISQLKWILNPPGRSNSKNRALNSKIIELTIARYVKRYGLYYVLPEGTKLFLTIDPKHMATSHSICYQTILQTKSYQIPNRKPYLTCPCPRVYIEQVEQSLNRQKLRAPLMWNIEKTTIGSGWRWQHKQHVEGRGQAVRYRADSNPDQQCPRLECRQAWSTGPGCWRWTGWDWIKAEWSRERGLWCIAFMLLAGE